MVCLEEKRESCTHFTCAHVLLRYLILLGFRSFNSCHRFRCDHGTIIGIFHFNIFASLLFLGHRYIHVGDAFVLNLAFLAGGIVLVEAVFNYPGIGLLLVESVRARDMPTVQAIALLIAALYVVLNLLADVATILVSPRLRTSLQ